MKQDQIIYQGDTSFTAMDGNSPVELEMAGGICQKLTEMYPGHPWICEVHIGLDGVPNITIRHWALACFGPYCYFINGKDIVSPTTFYHLLLTAGGEILERLGLPRVGEWDGTIPESMEDVEVRHDQRLRAH